MDKPECLKNQCLLLINISLRLKYDKKISEYNAFAEENT